MKMKSLGIILCAVLLPIVFSCSQKQTKNPEQELMDVDIYWSNYSVKNGRNAAFISMFDTMGVLLQEKSRPIEGIKSISEILLSESDTTYNLTWKPTFSKAAKSGELGYTYGIWEMHSKDNKLLLATGTYNTIWGKDVDGHWKALLDTGNLGLE
jgi:ketosteroid isomerase-like protein